MNRNFHSFVVVGLFFMAIWFVMVSFVNKQDISLLEYEQAPVLLDQTHSSFSITWSTNRISKAYFKFSSFPIRIDRQSPAQEVLTEDGHSFKALMSGLDSDKFYYFQPMNIAEGDTLLGDVQLYSPVSQSSGEIEIYFNNRVDSSFSSGAYPDGDHADVMLEAIIEKINSATERIDYCIYNTNMDEIVDALIAAHERGVRVRVIYNGTSVSANSSFERDLSFEYFVIEGDGLMHNKFLIIDSEDEDHAWIMTGSTNFTFFQVTRDPNHLLFIQDQNLAKAYEIEFEEMWGSDTATPNPSEAKKGRAKEDNTPHDFVVGGIPMELYFAPTDEVSERISNTLLTAQQSIDIALLIFTKWDIRDALISEFRDDIKIRGMVEDTDATGSVVEELLSEGVELYDHDRTGQLHHKYAIIDEGIASAKVITGSYNWTNSAETRHDENTLIIHSEEVANIFKQEFEERLKELGISATYQSESVSHNLYPNPSHDFIEITTEEPLRDVSVFNVSGRIVYSNFNALQKNLVRIDINTWDSGLYFVRGTTINNNSLLTSFVKLK